MGNIHVQKAQLDTIVFTGSIGLGELKGNSHGCGITGFLHVWLRETHPIICVHPIIYQLIYSVNLTDSGTKKKNNIQLRSSKRSLSCLRSLPHFLLWPSLVCYPLLPPLWTVLPHLPRSSFVPGSSRALFADPPPLPIPFPTPTFFFFFCLWV